MNYAIRDLALATRVRVLNQFGLSIPRGAVERAFQQFADQILNVCKARAEGMPDQPLHTFDFSGIIGISVEEPVVKDTPKPAPAPAKKATKQ